MNQAHKSLLAMVCAAGLTGTVFPSIADEPAGTLADAITGGEVKLHFRYRFEDVKQDNALDTAHASTLKSRLTYTTQSWQGWQAQVEAENISMIGNDNYNSTHNGKTGYSVVGDPKGTEINQAWIAYSGLFDSTLKYGRQRILLDGERFVGGVGWRQNEQTFDGVSIVNKSLPDTTVTYAYINNVNRVFGPSDGTTAAWKGNWDSEINLLNLNYAGLPFGTLSAYGYFMDIDDAPAQSNKTWGLRFAGKQALSDAVSLLYTLEYARQKDYGDNPVGYKADYYTIEGGLALPHSVTLTVGQEVLEGDKSRSGGMFRTPLATLHKFQGWADMFLATPDAGIEDTYAGVSFVLAGITANVVWHDFDAEDGGRSWGDELDVSFTRKFGKYVTGMLKYADYDADKFAVDTRKVWVQVQVDF